MFANYAAYAGQISPEGPPGMSGYGAPLGQQAPMGPGVSSDFGAFNAGPRAMAGMHAAMPAMMGAGILAGSFLPGAIGRNIGRLDPFQAGLSGFGRASGLTSGIKAGAGMGEMFGGMAENLGRIGAGGIGNIARAGMVGIGGAAVAALPAFIGMKAVEYVGGKAVEGAQFTNQVQHTLGQNFRFQNSQSQTGYGFSREQGSQIADTIRSMGNKEIMSSPQEMLRIMEQGVQGGLFRPVQDAKAFQTKFKELVGTLKEVAKTLNTTLEGAMPFLQEGRKMGFWTPADVMRMSHTTNATAAATGMSVAEVQQMQQQGAAMARSIGAPGATGFLGMTRTLDLVGGAQRSGIISEQRMSEITGGLQGSAATASFAGSMQEAATRFAASRRARWLLAATAGKDMQHLDAGKLGMLATGRMSLGQIQGMAEKNVQGRGAEFVMGEEDMRGDLLKMGPEGQAGLISAMAGSRLYGTSAMDKLVTRKLIQRNFGVGGKAADIWAEMARNRQLIIKENQQRAEAAEDGKARDQEEQMDHSYEGAKRKLVSALRKDVEEPIMRGASRVSQRVGDMWEGASDWAWNRAPRGIRIKGVEGSAAAAMRAAALGDTSALGRSMSTEGEIQAQFKRTKQSTSYSNLALTGNATFAEGGKPLSAEDVQKNMQAHVKELADTMNSGDIGLMGAAGRGIKRVGEVLTGIGAFGGVVGMLPGLATAGLGKGLEHMAGTSEGDIMRIFKGEDADQFRTAISYMWHGHQSPEKGGDPQSAIIGQNMLKSMAKAARDKGDKKTADMYDRMANDTGLQAKLAKMGGDQRDLNFFAGKDVVQKRMGKLKTQFDKNTKLMEQLNNITGPDKKSAGLGTLISALATKSAAGEMGLGQANDELSRIADAAVTADPTQIEAAKEALKGVPGAGQVYAALEAGSARGALKDSLTKTGRAGRGLQAAAINRVANELGIKDFISSDAIDTLTGHGKGHSQKQKEAVRQALAEKSKDLDPATQKTLASLVGGIEHGGTAGGVEALGAARKAGLVGINDAAADASKTATQRFRDKLGGEIIGKLGSSEGMHAELTNISSILRDIRGQGKSSPEVGAPKSEPDNGGFVGPTQ